MMTVVTYVTLREGSEPEWDAAMRERLGAAPRAPGWVRGQLLMPLDDLHRRLIVGTWRTRADWEAWHQDPEFAETRRRIEGLEAAPNETTWYEVVADHASANTFERIGRLARTAFHKARRVSP
jgi:heme-degrading monooxygenase HmoA